MRVNKYPLNNPRETRSLGEAYQGPLCRKTFYKIQDALKDNAHLDSIFILEWGLASQKYDWELEQEYDVISWGARRNWKSNGQEILLSKSQFITHRTNGLESSFLPIGLWSWVLVSPSGLLSLFEKKQIESIIQNRMIQRPGHKIKVHPGPEFDESTHQRLLDRAWKVSAKSSPMGIRLEHQDYQVTESPSITSSPVFPGVIQWSPAGPIILGPRAQTHGGYPRAWYLDEDALEQLIQWRPGQVLRFY